MTPHTRPDFNRNILKQNLTLLDKIELTKLFLDVAKREFIMEAILNIWDKHNIGHNDTIENFFLRKARSEENRKRNQD